MGQFSLLIKGGEVIDPAGNHRGQLDVGIRGSRIAAVERELPVSAATKVIDARNLVVTPGLVDLHTHVYRGVVRGSVDPLRLAWRTGVTTWMDAGSAGALTYPGFREYVIEPSPLTVRAFLNLSAIGLVGSPGEFAHPLFRDADLCARVALENLDGVVGIKVRIDRDTVGTLGLEPLRLARQAADLSGLPLMLHLSHGPPLADDVLPLLVEGDIVTHCFTRLSMGLLDEAGKPRRCFLEARERGVLFDIGHGMGSFSFDVADAMFAAGHEPDIISSDIHAEALEGSLRDLPTCLSKLRQVGMSLEDLVWAATGAPAAALGMDDVGSLRPGSRADVALFEWARGAVRFWDSYHAERTGDGELRNKLTIAAGRTLEPQVPDGPPPWTTATDARQQLQSELEGRLRRFGLPDATLPEGFGPPEPMR